MSESDLAGAFELLSRAALEDGQNGAGIFGHEFLDRFRKLIDADRARYDELDLTDCRVISSVVTAELFELPRPSGLAGDLCVHLDSPPGEARTFTFSRGQRLFGERERTLLELLRPHLSLLRDRVDLRPGSLLDGAGAGLTPREAEVLGWVARGSTNKEVAAILGVSPHTIRTQLEHVFEKLDVHTRTAAVAKARGVLSAGGGPRT